STRLLTSAKGKQPAKSSKAKSLFVLSEVAITEAEQMKLATKRSLQQTHISQASGSCADEGTDIIPGVPNVPTGQDAEDDGEESYRDVNINLEGRDLQMTDVHTTQEFEDTHVTLTLVNLDVQQQSSSVSSQFVTSMLNPSPDAGIDSLFESTPRMDVQATTIVAPLTLTVPTLPPPIIPTISQVPQAPTPPTTTLSIFLQDHLNFGSLFGFDHRLKTLEANFSEFVQTNQFAGATSYAVAADLSKMELKKILIEKMESNKSIHRSDEQRNLYKALVGAYICDKIILDTYRDTVTLKRRRDDADKDEKPSAGSDWGSERRREGKEPESTSTPKEKATKTTGKSTKGSKYHQKTASESAPAEEPMQNTKDLEEPSHQEFKTAATDDQPIAEASQHPECHKYTTSITKTKATDYGHIKWIEDLVPRIMLSQEPVSYDKYALWGISHWGRKRQQFYEFGVNRESTRDVYSKHRIIAVIELQIVEWHNYKHLDWITVHRDDDKLYKFKEGDFKRLRVQDIKDMLLLLV
nr:hypothetical protein [Tanacetum cinerariifolium]